MKTLYPNSQSMRLGVVMKRTPGVTRWAKWGWKASSVLPGAADAEWKLLRTEGEVSEYHAATGDVWLYVSDTEAYAHELSARDPSVYIVFCKSDDGPAGLRVLHMTVSPYEAQDYCDSAEEIVEKVAMPPAVLAWVSDFVDSHHAEEPFVKRRRDKHKSGGKAMGVGDHRIVQATDVYRAPTAPRHEAGE